MVERWKKRLVCKHNLTILHPFLNYVEWQQNELENILFNELKWEIPKGAKNSSRFGCEIDTLRQYLFYKTLGYNDTHVDLSCLIRDGQINKVEAEEVLISTLNIPEGYILYILTKAGIDAESFLKQLNKEYPSKGV